MQLVEKTAPRTSPIDPKEASKGRVEFVKVKDWGKGESPDDVGNLELISTETAHKHLELDPASAPLHEYLARRIEALEAGGAVSIAQSPRAAPMPPFERWCFKREHYLQYLTDIRAVYGALESVLDALIHYSSNSTSMSKALGLVGPSCGLARHDAIDADIKALGGDEGGIPPTQNAAGYVRLLESLAMRSQSVEIQAEFDDIALKVLAHAYLLYLVMVTSFCRVGAAATEKLSLFDAGAVAMWTDYPNDVGDPKQVFLGRINDMGFVLDERQKEALADEVVHCFSRVSMLLLPLAKER